MTAVKGTKVQPMVVSTPGRNPAELEATRRRLSGHTSPTAALVDAAPSNRIPVAGVSNATAEALAHAQSLATDASVALAVTEGAELPK